MKTVIVGGGAAGFFAAVNLKAMAPRMEVTIIERSQRVLSKVLVSGGGRCNCTNSFGGVTDLSQVYPRGHRLLKRLFKTFGPQDAFHWFESHGVPLVVQADGCVFPKAQDSRAVAGCLTSLASHLGVTVQTGHPVASFSEIPVSDFTIVTTGGMPKAGGMQWLADSGHTIEQPVASLFSLSVADEALRALQGTVTADCTVRIPATRFSASGPLLLTHWGMSGPAILRLSSYAARHLHDNNYRVPLSVCWVPVSADEASHMLSEHLQRQPQKLLTSTNPFGFSSRLWEHLVGRAVGQQPAVRCGELGRKSFNRLLNTLTNDEYATSGRAAFRDEFVTCGGVSLKSVDPNTLESRHVPRLFFAGEVLDIDGVTGGFNFQAAWTTAYTVAKAIASHGG